MSHRIRHSLSELESLAITPKRLNDLNDAYEMEHLVDNIKLSLFQDFSLIQFHKQAYFSNINGLATIFALISR